jgi:hypothetical protein
MYLKYITRNKRLMAKTIMYSFQRPSLTKSQQEIKEGHDTRGLKNGGCLD